MYYNSYCNDCTSIGTEKCRRCKHSPMPKDKFEPITDNQVYIKKAYDKFENK